MRKIGKMFIGILLGAVLAYVTCSAISSGSKKSVSKVSYYDTCDFDFIIPKPWYKQIPEIQDKDFVSSVVPFYVTKRKISGKENSCDVNLFMIEKYYGLNNTAYDDSLFIEGNGLFDGTVVIDERTKKSLNMNVGDDVSISIGDSTFKFKISGICRDNIFSNYPSSVIYYDGAVKREVESFIENLAYTGAYVKTSDVSAAENYFTRDYRAMGNVGDRSWYETDDSYNFMKASIEKQNVAKEVVNVAQLRVSEKSNVAERKKSESKVMFISFLIIFLGNFIFWLLYVLFSSKGYRERIKAGATQVSVVTEFILGEICTLIAFSACLYLLKGKENLIPVVPYMIVMLVSFILALLATSKIIWRKRRGVSR